VASTLRQLFFLALSLAATLGLMMALARQADALFSGSEIDLSTTTLGLMVIAMACGLAAWLLRRL
jgi:hypothetical protein